MADHTKIKIHENPNFLVAATDSAGNSYVETRGRSNVQTLHCAGSDELLTNSTKFSPGEAQGKINRELAELDGKLHGLQKFLPAGQMVDVGEIGNPLAAACANLKQPERAR